MKVAKKNPMNKRACWHDYRSRSIYMITLSKADGAPMFSEIVNVGDKKVVARVNLLDAGKIIERNLFCLEKEFSMIKILKYCIMPDHLHFLIFVRDRLEKPLGNLIQILKWNCNRDLKELLSVEKTVSELAEIVMFGPSFNDKIVYRKGQKDNFFNYIADNPRRWLALRECSGFFQRVNTFIINGERYSLYGNLFLLNHPLKVNVRFSRRFTPEQLLLKEREYEEVLRSGGVFVSPFIHPNEREVRTRGVEAGVGMIQIMMNGFSEKFKPSGADFDLCLQGRLLLIAPEVFSTRKVELHREMALHGNRIAELVCALSASTV